MNKDRNVHVACWLQVFACEHANLDLEQIFGREAQSLVAHLNIEGQHRGAVAAASAMQQHESAHSHADSGPEFEHDPKKCKLCHDEHDHDHEHDHGHDHSHEHAHDDHGHAMPEEKGGKDKHAHGHSHDGDHHHEHKHGVGHHHGHHHDHKRQETTAAERFGIRSFVYKRRLPFHPQR